MEGGALPSEVSWSPPLLPSLLGALPTALLAPAQGQHLHSHISNPTPKLQSFHSVPSLASGFSHPVGFREDLGVLSEWQRPGKEHTHGND